ARANVTAEERHRRLERLRREQEELQRQAAQLAEELRQQQSATQGGAQPGQQPGGQQPGETSDAAGAAAAMRGAAESLGRNDIEQAGQQSAQAGERQRDLERALGTRGGRTAAQAMNDARLEAQQLAEAQQRL